MKSFKKKGPHQMNSIGYRFDLSRQQALAYDNHQKIGECDFEIENNEWIITHTFVDPQWTGHGIARQLVLLVREQAVQAGVTLHSRCSYASKVLADQ